jgi:hypothetical protein
MAPAVLEQCAPITHLPNDSSNEAFLTASPALGVPVVTSLSCSPSVSATLSAALAPLYSGLLHACMISCIAFLALVPTKATSRLFFYFSRFSLAVLPLSCTGWALVVPSPLMELPRSDIATPRHTAMLPM